MLLIVTWGTGKEFVDWVLSRNAVAPLVEPRSGLPLPLCTVTGIEPARLNGNIFRGRDFTGVNFTRFAY